MKQAILTLALALAAAAAQAQPELVPDRRPEPLREVAALAVGGNGEVRVAPDEATVRLGVTRQADTARRVQEQVNVAAQGILAAVLKLGIKREDIQTSQLVLVPIFSQPKPGSNDEPKIVAYQASNVVSVRSDKLDLIGPVIDAALEAGSNRLEGVFFGLRNDQPARLKALAQAVQEAHQKAAAIADAMEVKLGPVLQVQEGGVGIMPPPIIQDRAMFARAGAAEAPTPVLPGQITVTASVTVRYRIRER